MSLVNMNQMLCSARDGRYALGNFDVFNMEMLRGVIEAAEEERSPVILAYVDLFESISNLEEFTAAMTAMANNASVPVAVHLDHATTLEYVKRAIDAGFTSVMMDASEQPFEENARRTKQVVEFCKAAGVSVEAELGHVGGLEGHDEGCDDETQEYYTDVAEAVEFVKQTDVDALAVAIGTVHGVYKSKPVLSFDRLRELREKLSVPLVLHGASGLSDDDFRATISGGICKANIFTDLTLAAKDAISESLASEHSSYFDLALSVKNAVKCEAAAKIKLFGSSGKA